MKLYILTQDVCSGYDTYDSIVVAAKNETSARLIGPNGPILPNEPYYSGSWPSYDHIDKIDVKLIGTAVPGTEAGLILASFNAG